MRIEINDWDLVENNAVYFKGRVALAQAWLDLFSDFGDVPLPILVEPANKFAIGKKLPFRVIEAVSQNEEGEIDWIIEML